MRDEQIRVIVKRLFFFGIFILIVPFLLFWWVRSAPGDPAVIRAGPNASPEMIENVRHQYGYDQPVLVQYKNYVWGLIHGDLGDSIIYPEESVGSIIISRMKMSVPIGLSALLLSLLAGTVIGLVAAIKKGWLDAFLINFAISFQAIPVIITILFLILFFSVKLDFLPPSWSGGWAKIFSLSAVIPVLALFLASLGGFARAVRTYTMPVLDEDYVMVARASGFSFWRVAFKYILRNSLLPLVTGIIPAFFFVMITGSFFVETIYKIDGLGAFMVSVAFQRDYDVFVSMAIISGVLMVLANLLADITYTFVDPRISLERGNK